MPGRWLGVALLAMTAQAHAQTAGDRQPTRVGWAFQLDLATGGDDLYNRETHASETNLGQGVTASLGAFFRPKPASDFQLLGLVGFKSGVGLPASDEEADVTRWVFQLLAHYPLENKWYVGGGLAVHTNPKYVDEYPGAIDVDFDDAIGATIEGGWSWIGLQCTYMEYRAPGLGNFNASNCGVRFTWRFHKYEKVPR